VHTNHNFWWCLGLSIDIQISGYENTHMIIQNRVQTVRVCAACLDTVERVVSWYSETWYECLTTCDHCSNRHQSAVQSPECSCSKDSGRPTLLGPSSSSWQGSAASLTNFVPCRCGLVFTGVKGHVPCVASPFCLFPSPSPLVLSLPHIKCCGCGN